MEYQKIIIKKIRNKMIQKKATNENDKEIPKKDYLQENNKGLLII